MRKRGFGSAFISVIFIVFTIVSISKFIVKANDNNLIEMDDEFEPLAVSIYSFINDSRWANGVSWGNGQRPKLSKWDSIDCCAYCADYVKFCYGSDYPWSCGTAFYNKNDIRAGDVVQVTGHYFVVVERSGDSLYVAEGNYVWKCPPRVMIDWRYTVSGINNFIQGWHYPVVTSTPATPTPTPTPIVKGTPMQKGYDRVLPDGDYIIANSGTNDMNTFYYLDIAGADYPAKNNTNVVLCSMDAQTIANRDIDYEVWTIEYSDGFYTIRQKGTEMYLDVLGNSSNGDYLNRGANVEVFENYPLTQKWAISRNDETMKGYRVQAQCSGFSLDLSGNTLKNGTNIQQWTGNSSNAQSWMFIPYKPAQPIKEGRYVLLLDFDNKWEMDVEGDSADIPDYTNVRIWEDTADSSFNSFDVIPQKNGYYKIINVSSGKALTVEGGANDFYANILVSQDWETTAKEWAIVPCENGWELVPRCSGLAVDVKYDGTWENGKNVIQYPRHGGINQTWVFVEAEYCVKYDANGGSGAPSMQTKYYKRNLTLSNVEPVREGYTFLGWTTASESDEVEFESGTEYQNDANLTLYAVWKPNISPTPTPNPTSDPTPIPTLTKVPTKNPTPNPTTKPDDPTPTPTPEKEPSIADFVERLYTIALNRPSEPEGKAFWVNEIESGNRTGGACAHFFLIEAQEFLNRGLTDEDFVETLYQTFFDRASEPNGQEFWVGKLKSGAMTKENVINGFIDSTEWCNVCATYGVKSGAPYAKAEIASKNAIDFATRLYTCCLGRDSEEGGLKYWSLALTNLEQTGASAAQLFFESPEFVGFSTSNTEYVTRLYRTFMGREPEAEGLAYWVRQLNSGTSRREVMAGFAVSQEFTNICKKYGIERGEINMDAATSPAPTPPSVNPKGAAESYLANIRSIANSYGWTVSTEVVRNTNTQYGIYVFLEITIGNDGEYHCSSIMIKSELSGNSISTAWYIQTWGSPAGTRSYDDFGMLGSGDHPSVIEYYGIQ